MFNFQVKTHVRFGTKSRLDLKTVLKAQNWSRSGIIVDHGVVNLPMVTDLLDGLRHEGIQLFLQECEISEPTYDVLESKRKYFQGKDIQVMVGIGGGSAIDMAKGIAVLVHNHKPALEYRGFDKMVEPVLPIIAIPTTAGTGSEVTPNASFIDVESNKKLGINGEAVRPIHALLDPELTLSCPHLASLSAGVDSLVHAIEAYVAKKTNSLARFFAREGFITVSQFLPEVLQNPKNLVYREKVMYGSFLAGIALMHSGTGPAAAMSYPLGVHYQVPHGIGGGIFLPHVIRYNVMKSYFDYGLLLSDGNAGNSEEHGLKFCSFIEKLWEKLEVPTTLRYLQLDQSQRDEFVSEVVELRGALEQNPVPFGRKEVSKVLSQLLDENAVTVDAEG